MNDINALREDFETNIEKLKQLIDESFSLMDQNPGQKTCIIGLWQSLITQFLSHTFKTSEKFKNKDVFKAITKTMIFGK